MVLCTTICLLQWQVMLFVKVIFATMVRLTFLTYYFNIKVTFFYINKQKSNIVKFIDVETYLLCFIPAFFVLNFWHCTKQHICVLMNLNNIQEKKNYEKLLLMNLNMKSSKQQRYSWTIYQKREKMKIVDLLQKKYNIEKWLQRISVQA